MRDTEGFERLEQEWNLLLGGSPSDSLFLTWDWLFTWYRLQAKRLTLSLLVLRSDGEPVAIAPLARRAPSLVELRPYPSLVFLGTGSAGSDYLDLIVRRGAEEQVSSFLGSCLAGEKNLLELAQIRLGSSFSESLGEVLAARGWNLRARATGGCPYINLAGQTWEGYLQNLGANHRYNFQRRLRNLHKEFDVRFERVTTEGERLPALRSLIRLHNLRFRERGGSDAFHTPRLMEFHEEFSRRALERGWLRLFVLYLGDRPAAALYGFRYNGTFYFYQSGFDPDLGKWSVGLVVMGLAIRSALEEAALEYDLLHGDEAYKSHWANGRRELGRLELYPPYLRGTLYRHAADGTRAARRMAGWLVRRARAGWLSTLQHMESQRKAYAARTD